MTGPPAPAPPLRLAVVGLGWAGTRQVEASREPPPAERRLEVTWLVDTDAGELQARAVALGVPRTATDLRRVLDDPEVDAVSICTPHTSHAPLAVAAAGAGKHVLVEKPMALTVDEATRMIDAAAAAGVALYVAESATYSMRSRFLRRLVTEDRLGEVVAASWVSGFRAPRFGYEGRRAWLTQPGQGGTGTWMLHGIHTMAVLRYVLGEVATVYLREHHARSFAGGEIEGTVSGLLTLAGGAHVGVLQTCEVQLDRPEGTTAGFTVYGDRGTVRALPDGYLLSDGAEDRLAGAPPGRREGSPVGAPRGGRTRTGWDR